MYKLIDKIPENIPEDKIEKKIINYRNYECPYKTRIVGNAVISDRGASEFFINTLARFGLLHTLFSGNNSKIKTSYDSFGEIPKDGNASKIKSSFSFDFYMADSFGLIPKKWIDGKKEVFIYNNGIDKYYHLIVGEYKEKL